MTLAHRLRAAAGANAGGEVYTVGLKLHWDFGDTNCWDGTSSTINDLSGWSGGNTHGTVNMSTNPPSLATGNGGYMLNSATPEYNNIQFYRDLYDFGIGMGEFTIEIWHNSPAYIYPGGNYPLENTLLRLDWADFHNWTSSQIRYMHVRLGFQQPSTYVSQLQGASFEDPFNWNSFYGNNLEGSGSTFTYWDSGEPTSNPPTGWEQIVLSRDAANASNNMKIYRNGTLINTTTNTIDYTPQQITYKFSESRFGNNIPNGATAIYRIYDGNGLTADQVLGNFKAQRSRFGI